MSKKRRGCFHESLPSTGSIFFFSPLRSWRALTHRHRCACLLPATRFNLYPLSNTFTCLSFFFFFFWPVVNSLTEAKTQKPKAAPQLGSLHFIIMIFVRCVLPSRCVCIIQWEVTDRFDTLIWQSGAVWCNTEAPRCRCWRQVVSAFPSGL